MKKLILIFVVSIFLHGCVGLAGNFPSERIVKVNSNTEEIESRWGKPDEINSTPEGEEWIYFNGGGTSFIGVVIGLGIPIPLVYPQKQKVRFLVHGSNKVERIYSNRSYGFLYGCIPPIYGGDSLICGDLSPRKRNSE